VREPPTGHADARGADDLESRRALINAEALCTAQGQRLNEAGRRVLKTLLASDRALKAYDLTHALATGGRSAGPPTIYRALRLLVGVGLAHRIESLNAFVACRFPGEAHLPGFRICESCGATEEFKVEPIPSQAAGHGDCRLVFEILGPCRSCGRSPGQA
jgi:Fur family zinc uptake transcriptional regulator